MEARTALENALRRDRAVVAASLAGAAVLSWLYLVPASRDMYGDMRGLSAWMMSATWDARYFLLVFSMWCVMMVGMMLPGATPAILLFAAASRGNARPVARTYAFAAGYLVAWIAFSLGATTLQRLLAGAELISPMMELASPSLGAALLIGVGLYQWTPYKRRCLSQCRSPFYGLARAWRPGVAGALRMGISHGVYCVGCCWALMLLLFFGGVMNLVWISVIALFVLIEKLAPHAVPVDRIGGALLIAAGLWLIVGAPFAP